MSSRSTQLTTTDAFRAETGWARRLGPLALVVAVALGGLGLDLLGPGASIARAAVIQAAPQSLVGGLSNVTLGDFAVARDGSGGLTYTATVGGISHVYFSRLLGGVFQTPQELDAGGLTSASQPVVTADNGGEVLVAFISGGGLYVSDALSTSSGLSSPQLIATSASNPSISMNLYGVGYLAYTAADGGGDDVDVQYFDGSSWSPASPEAMNATPGDGAGTGTGGPSVAAASDGVGIVAWGEGGHVYSRRVWGTATSVEVEQDDVPGYGGLSEVSATSPQVAVGGDSTYPDIVFSETLQAGSATVTRAMLTRLLAETTRTAVPVDGIAAGGQNGILPAIAMGELGRGLATVVTGAVASPARAPITTTATTTSTGPTTTGTGTTTTGTGTTTTGTGTTTTGAGTTTTGTGTTTTGTGTTTTGTGTGTTTTGTTTTTTTTSILPSLTAPAATTTVDGTTAPFGVESTVLGQNGAQGTPQSTASADIAEPAAAPGVFGSTASGVVWDQDNGAGISQVLLSYSTDGVLLGAPTALSSALAGPVQPASGLLLAGDGRADAAAVWVQGVPGALAIYTDQLYTPETQPGLKPANVFTNSAQPVLTWGQSAEFWGGVTYAVTLNGTPVADTTATSLTLGPGLIDGTYSWNVTAVNAVGDQLPSGPGKLVVDTFAPRLRLRLTGSPLAKSTQHLTLGYKDPANPTEPGATASGVKSVSINWGDGTKIQTGKALTGATHAYGKAGIYSLVVTVTDEANNVTPLTRLVRVLP